mmetsp:Transcript_12781/g.40090  ORF Transcript_12781/g.40090 Transcript_12781/m.40090 type:complete len:354 (+) Transcript_12781:126-1187(+)
MLLALRQAGESRAGAVPHDSAQREALGECAQVPGHPLLAAGPELVIAHRHAWQHEHVVQPLDLAACVGLRRRAVGRAAQHVGEVPATARPDVQHGAANATVQQCLVKRVKVHGWRGDRYQQGARFHQLQGRAVQNPVDRARHRHDDDVALPQQPVVVVAEPRQRRRRRGERAVDFRRHRPHAQCSRPPRNCLADRAVAQHAHGLVHQDRVRGQLLRGGAASWCVLPPSASSKGAVQLPEAVVPVEDGSQHKLRDGLHTVDTAPIRLIRRHNGLRRHITEARIHVRAAVHKPQRWKSFELRDVLRLPDDCNNALEGLRLQARAMLWRVARQQLHEAIDEARGLQATLIGRALKD